MSRTIAIVLSLAVLGAAPTRAQSDNAVAKGIHDREVQWRTAISLGNWSAVESFMAKDFVVTLADGTRLDRGEYMKELERRTATFAAVPEPEYKVLVYGQTAVHLGEANLIATGADGASMHVHIVWTDTWVRKQDGQWICLASQYARVSST